MCRQRYNRDTTGEGERGGNHLTESGVVVKAGASVAVTACSNLVVERAVNPEDRIVAGVSGVCVCECQWVKRHQRPSTKQQVLYLDRKDEGKGSGGSRVDGKGSMPYLSFSVP